MLTSFYISCPRDQRVMNYGDQSVPMPCDEIIKYNKCYH